MSALEKKASNALRAEPQADETAARSNEVQIPQQEEPPKEPPTKARITVSPVRNNIEAELMLQRTGTNTEDPTLEELRAAVKESNIAFGLREDVLPAIASRPVYNRPLLIAVGKKASVGRDGYIEYLVPTTRELKPKIREDGTADYRDLDYVHTVVKGQVLCNIHLPEKGEDGMDVLGNVLEGQYGKTAASPVGAGTELSDDGLQLIASVSGGSEVSKSGMVTIKDVLKIQGNVDTSTGDIEFSGDVIVQGDVATGFRIATDSNISVKGTVEGAILEAAGDIIVGSGVNGMDNGKLVAGGNIKCQYIQNCNVKAEGNIYADSIMYANTECGGDLELTGKWGTLVGGRLFLAGKLMAKTIGSRSHTATQINMCSTGLSKNYELESLTEQIKDADAEITKYMQLLNFYDDLAKKNKMTQEHIENVVKIKNGYLALSETRKELTEAIERTKREQLELATVNSYIECTGRIHSGVRMTFGPLTMLVSESFVFSRVGIANGEITISSL